MIVSYTHDDRVESYSTQDLSTMESAEVERVTGLEWEQVERALKEQKPLAMSAIVWVFRRRQTGGLRFADFDLPQWKRRLKARLEREEILDLLEGVQLQFGDEEALEDAAKNLRVLAHKPDDVDWALAEMAPKAPAPAPQTSRATSNTSPAPKGGSETSSTSTGP